jgi:GDP-D-mannose dehydratase
LAEKDLGWKPKTTLDELVEMMVKYDLSNEDYGGIE